MTKTINRDVGQQGKGFRLQKLRAAELMLEAVEKSSKQAQIYCAVEYGADVHIVTASETTTVKYNEEDKNLNPQTGLSINSSEILNSLIIFIDSYCKNHFSKNLYFGFYTTTLPSKENLTEKLKTLNVALPSVPVLELLKQKNFSDSSLIDLIQKVVCEEYQKQYSTHPNDGNLDYLRKWTPQNWIDFLSQITWDFGQLDEVALEKTLIEKIKNSKYYDQTLHNKEQHVLGSLCDMFDSRQSMKDPTERFIHGSDIVLTFKEISSEKYRLDDPTFSQWENLPPCSDSRNLDQKIKTVCENFRRRKLEIWCRKIGGNIDEQKQLEQDKSIASLKFQVLLICEQHLDELLKSPQASTLSTEQIESWCTELIEKSKEHIKERAKNYKYTVSNDTFIEGIVLWLFDSCFLSFENTENT